VSDDADEENEGVGEYVDDNVHVFVLRGVPETV
jgi:hypothetical protein